MPVFRSRIARKALLTSLEKIEDERPYSTPFETAIASSSERTRISAVVGPKIAEDRRAVVEAFVEPVPPGDLATGQELRALVLSDLRVGVDLLERRLVDHRPDVGVVLPAGAEPHLLDARDEARGELVVDGLVDDHAARGRAALARGAESRPDDAVDGQIEIGVVHDDDRVLAAEL